MKKELKAYRARIDGLLENPGPDTDWEALKREQEVHIRFFQHERLIHLLVTLAFAVMTLLSLGLVLVLGDPLLLLLLGLFLALLIPYIFHYYALENGVQSLYGQYDRIAEKRRNSSDSAR